MHIWLHYLASWEHVDTRGDAGNVRHHCSGRAERDASCLPLWGALKGKAYANKPRTIQELENNIRREIAAISEDILQATFANMKRRVQLCLDSCGEHFQHLL